MAKRPKKKGPKGIVKSEASQKGSKGVFPGDSASGTVEFHWWQRNDVRAAALVLSVFLAYLPVWNAGFIWDDDDHLTQNPCIVGPLGLKEIWTTSNARYYPLVLTTFWLEHHLWGLAPLPYHLVNVLMHGACAIVLWRVLLRLQIRGAWLGAALWALHPIMVETVAWVSELKNTQSCLFFLLSILFYVKRLTAVEAATKRHFDFNYAWALVFAAMAMTSKSSTVVLPLVLCLCVWWVRRKWEWREMAWIGPVFLMSLASAVMTVWSVRLLGDLHNPQWKRSWPERIAEAGDVFWFYLGKLVWPHPLSFIYPRWTVDPRQWLSYVPSLAAVIFLSILWLKRENGGRPYFFAVFYFLVALLPVLGLVNHYYLRYSLVADHMQYLASIGPLALLGAGLSRVLSIPVWGKTWLPGILSVALLLILAALSWQQSLIYKNMRKLWADTITKNPTCWLAENNLATFLLKKGDVEGAWHHYEEAVRIKHDNALAYSNLGGILFREDQWPGAISEYEQAVRYDANDPINHYDLGSAYLQVGQLHSAMEQFIKAVNLDSSYTDAQHNLGLVYLLKGRPLKAIARMEEVVRLQPDSAEAHKDLGVAELDGGEVPEAIEQFQWALRLKPGYAEASFNLANAFAGEGRMQDAIGMYEQAIQEKPDYAEAYNNMGAILLHLGKVSEAIQQFQQALKAKPNYTEARRNLAKAQAKMG